MADPAGPNPPTDQTFHLRPPSKYASATAQISVQPDLDFLLGTWGVTHSTLPMWRSARNVRITYKALPPTSDSGEGEGLVRLDDLVEYQSSKDARPVADAKTKSVAGIDTQATAGDLTSWNWKGKGWLFFVHSHWEILGFGERPSATAGGAPERWVVTWFQKTIFSAEGFDIYSSSTSGLSDEAAETIVKGLKALHPKIAEMMDEMKPVEIQQPVDATT